MTLIVLALIVAFFIGLNCFYNISGLICYVAGIEESNKIGSFKQYVEDNRAYDESEF